MPVKNILSVITEIVIDGLKESIEGKLNIAQVEKGSENDPEISRAACW